MKKIDGKNKNVFSSFFELIASLFSFGKNKKTKLSILEEEAISSPTKTIVKNFFSNRLSIIGLTTFIIILFLTFGLAAFIPLDIYYSEPVLKNIAPGFGYLKVPDELQKDGIKSISSGISYSIGLSEKGKVYMWGKDVDNATKMPKDLKGQAIKQVVSGDKHVLVLTEGGKVFGWGNDSFGQTTVPFELEGLLMLDTIVQIGAGDQYSAVLTAKGNLYVWGSVLNNKLDIIPADVQGRIKKIECTSYNMLLLLDDGTVRVTGVKGNELSEIPSYLLDGSVKIVDIAVTYRDGLALDENGKLYVWGNKQYGLTNVPETSGKVVKIDSGRNHFVALTDNGNLYAWGGDHYGQQSKANGLTDVKNVYTDFFQTFVVMKDGKVNASGNNGFLFGSDEFGRDLALRLIHGGKVTLTVGAISVLIATFIGMVVGLVSGFYGGWIDNVLMRFAEIINSFPFLPLAITLSTFLGGDVTQSEKMALIMVILGIISWPGLSRLIRGQILSEREKDFVLAAKALGLKERVIIVRHILPNVVNLIIVSMTLSYAGSLLTEAGLSFLGFGIIPPSPSWGNMLTGAQNSKVISDYWWRWIIPAVSILIAALSINLVGDGLTEAMDPKSNEK